MPPSPSNHLEHARMSTDKERLLEDAGLVLDTLIEMKNTNSFSEEDHERSAMNGWPISKDEKNFLMNEPFHFEEDDEENADFNLEDSDVMCIVDSVEEALEIITVIKGEEYTRNYPYLRNKKMLIADLEYCIEAYERM